jgi:uroporphyrinogen decarboxylase
VVQIFDSWAGDVPEALRGRVVEEPIAAIVNGVRKMKPGFPVTVFGRGIGDGHRKLALATGANAMGVEQGPQLSDVLQSLPDGVAVQGNLDPGALLLPPDDLARQVVGVLRDVPKARHVFNLGHGITPGVDPSQVSVMLNAIRAFDGV